MEGSESEMGDIESTPHIYMLQSTAGGPVRTRSAPNRGPGGDANSTYEPR